MSSEKIYIAGHRGMVGSAIARRLQDQNLVFRTHAELDLLDHAAVRAFFAKEQVTQVYLAAAKVGGIHANNAYPAEFIYENLTIQCNIVQAAHANGVQKLLFLGSSCIYPKLAEQPMKEEALLSGPLEPTNEPYAVAKIAGIKLCESCNRQYGRDYRSVMPTNLYGPGDNFHPENSHVIPALMRRFYEAAQRGDEQVVVWGTGQAMREFLHVDDMAEACIHVMNLEPAAYQSVTQPMLSHINIGTGVDCTIRELAETMADVTGFQGKLVFDDTKPDGTPRKLLDTTKIAQLGWKPSFTLKDGLQQTYAWFVEHATVVRENMGTGRYCLTPTSYPATLWPHS